MAGPLKGIRIIEFAGIGPGPYCGMMLADHGAEVIRIDRPGGFMDPRDPLSRNRTSIALDIVMPPSEEPIENSPASSRPSTAARMSSCTSVCFASSSVVIE